ncbi:MAG: alpha/beta hydrolase fold domain-containing protein [Lachnospiraceae bacterium]|nr:alpha/beta hydrolase fold domain-containing protein [Lachnospiraceae bacterium]
MKKKHLIQAICGAAALAWCAYRDWKYPIQPAYWLMNKFVVPAGFLKIPLIQKANRMMERMPLPEVPDGMTRETMWAVSKDGEKVRLTVYGMEEEKEPMPCLYYIHGGGFCMGDAWYIHDHVAEYAKKAHCKVVFVHYRTSDDHPFPVPFEDCVAGLQYVWENCEWLGVDPERIAIGGDSAGGALAAACSLWAREEGAIPLCFQMLIYPVTDSRMETESMKKYRDCPSWNSGLNQKMWEIYLRNGDFGMAGYAAPMLAERFDQLPAAYVEVEEFDCLHDEGLAYADALCAAGVSVQVEDVKGTFHGFDVFEKTKATKRMIEIRCSALRRAFWE